MIDWPMLFLSLVLIFMLGCVTLVAAYFKEQRDMWRNMYTALRLKMERQVD